jgi:glutaredoxin 3
MRPISPTSGARLEDLEGTTVWATAQMQKSQTRETEIGGLLSSRARQNLLSVSGIVLGSHTMRGDPILYVRRGCPWCREALAFFSSHGASLEIRDVSVDHNHLRSLAEVSGQTQTPTFEYGDFIVADFSIEEFIDELQERPDIQSQLGITDDSHIA